jgi:5-methylcytosine-specific restriction endonuclease McrA
MVRTYWRLRAIEAVNYTCQVCGNRFEYKDLELHHVDPFHVIVVCKKCHRKLLRQASPRSRTKPRDICPKCGKPGIPRTHTTITYHKGVKYIYRYKAFEHPEENRWCNLGKYISREVVKPD